jgi:hypothetical protein
VKPFITGGFRPHDHPVALDVDADEVAVRVSPGKADGVLPFAASDFCCHRMAVSEKEPVKPAFENEVPEVQNAGLDDVWKTFGRRVFDPFLFSHFALKPGTFPSMYGSQKKTLLSGRGEIRQIIMELEQRLLSWRRRY